MMCCAWLLRKSLLSQLLDPWSLWPPVCPQLPLGVNASRWTWWQQNPLTQCCVCSFRGSWCSWNRHSSSMLFAHWEVEATLPFILPSSWGRRSCRKWHSSASLMKNFIRWVAWGSVAEWLLKVWSLTSKTQRCCPAELPAMVKRSTLWLSST